MSCYQNSCFVFVFKLFGRTTMYTIFKTDLILLIQISRGKTVSCLDDAKYVYFPEDKFLDDPIFPVSFLCVNGVLK